jgi:hypothetical protein
VLAEILTLADIVAGAVTVNSNSGIFISAIITLFNQTLSLRIKQH